MKIKPAKNYIIIILALMILLSGVIKLSLVDWNKNVHDDSGLYYLLATHYLYHHNIEPRADQLHNIGFPIFLASIFYFFPFHLDLLSDVQRITTIAISLALIPITYLFSRQFFSWKLSLVGAFMIAFDYRLIINSTLGITEPLFLIFVFSSLYYGVRKHIVSGFLFASLSVLVRFEGIMLFIPLIYLVLKYKIKPVFSIIISSLIILSPVITLEHFGIFQKVLHETPIMGSYISELFNGNSSVIFDKLVNSLVYMGWFTFPMFIFLIPFGLFVVIKYNWIERNFILLMLVILLSTGIYAYMDAYDTRYFMMAYPPLILVSLSALDYFIPKIGSRSKKIWKLNQYNKNP